MRDDIIRILHSLQRLSFYKRIFIVFASFVFIEFLIVCSLYIRGTDRGVSTLLVMTGIAAAWLFPVRLAFMIEVSLLVVYLSIGILIIGWDWTILMAVPIGICTDLFILCTVGFLRLALEKEKAMRIREQKLVETKDQFIANINHELRSPIAIIAGVLEVFKENSDNLAKGDFSRFLDDAIYSCNNLQLTANNVLYAIDVEEDIVSPWLTEFSLDRVIFDTLRHVDAQDHCLFIDISEDINVIGDIQQVGQVLCNLVNNAFKYSPAQAPVTVESWRDDTYAYVCVKDCGPGIPPDQISLLFQKCSRLKRDIGGPIRGIGLGLYICRRFIDGMAGSIWVESTGIEGRGSSFYFTLPLASQQKEARQIAVQQKETRQNDA